MSKMNDKHSAMNTAKNDFMEEYDNEQKYKNDKSHEGYH